MLDPILNTCAEVKTLCSPLNALLGLRIVSAVDPRLTFIFSREALFFAVTTIPFISPATRPAELNSAAENKCCDFAASLPPGIASELE